MPRLAESGVGSIGAEPLHGGGAQLPARARLWAAAGSVVGLLLVGWAVARAGNGAAYLAGLVLCASAVVVTAATVTARPWRIVAAAALGLLAAAVAAAAPWAALRVGTSERGTAVASRGDSVGWVVEAGDIVLLDLNTEGPPGEIAVVDVADGAVVHQETERDFVVAGRGPIAAFAFGDPLRDVVALAPDGSERWRLDAAELGFPTEPDPDDAGILPRPVAVLEDGALVVASRDRRLFAIDAAGTERWRVELPAGVDALGGARGPIPIWSLPARVIASDGDGVFEVDGATGELRPLDDVVDFAVGDEYGYVALVHRRGATCTLEIDTAGREPIELERACAAEAAPADLVAFDEVIDLSIGDVDETIDPRTGGSEPRRPHADEPYDLVVDERSVHALGSDAVVPVGPGAAVSEFSTSSTIVVLRDIESRNPLRPAHRTGVDIYDAATGERCATATYDGSATGFGLTGCQAVVSVYGGSTYILRGETGT